MELTSELLGNAAVGIVVILAALGAYLRSLKARPPDPVIAGVGIELGNREQMERLIVVQTRIAAALETLADKRTDEMAEMHRQLLDRLDRRTAEPRRRRSPRKI